MSYEVLCMNTKEVPATEEAKQVAQDQIDSGRFNLGPNTTATVLDTMMAVKDPHDGSILPGIPIYEDDGFKYVFKGYRPYCAMIRFENNPRS